MTRPAPDALLLAEASDADEFAKVWAEFVRGGQIQCLRSGGNACIEDFAKTRQRHFDPKPTGLPPPADRWSAHGREPDLGPRLSRRRRWFRDPAPPPATP